MFGKIAKRLVTVIPTLIGVVIVTFLLTRVLPGDTAAYFAGPAATAESIAEIRKTLGLDRPARHHGDSNAAARLGGADADRPGPVDGDRGAARHSRGREAGFSDRP